ncbi:MAG: hypothetical protein IH604_03310 [Burkholderiales bacterium]|nr:hypothetical protein [Burkholderiales bacterium]
MNTLAHEPPHHSLPVGRIAAFLAGGIAIVALVVSAQGFDGGVAPAADIDVAAVPTGVALAAPNPRCAECGVIESVQEIQSADESSPVRSPPRIATRNRGEIETKKPGKYAITIRMRDGSMRVIEDANPATWRRGEPVTIIAGVD